MFYTYFVWYKNWNYQPWATSIIVTEHFTVASATEELNFYFILVNLNLNSHTWLEAAILDSTVLHDYQISTKISNSKSTD